MGLARELARKALMGALTRQLPVEEALDLELAIKSASGRISESGLRKTASHARAIVGFGRIGGEPVLQVAQQRLAQGGGEEDLRRLLLQVNIQEALASRSALNAERAHHQAMPSFADAFYAAIGHIAGGVAPSPSEFAMALVEASPDCIKIISKDGRLLFLSENGRCALEIESFEAVAGMAWVELWPETERGKVLEAMQRARNGRAARFEGAAPTLKGHIKSWEVSVSPIRASTGDVRAMLAISRMLGEASVTSAPTLA